MYFLQFRLPVAVDEKDHLVRNENKEEERESKIKETLECRFVRINLNKEKFDAFIEISKIFDIIDEIKEKKKNKSVDKIKRKYKKYVDKIKKRNKEKVEKLLRQNN